MNKVVSKHGLDVDQRIYSVTKAINKISCLGFKPKSYKPLVLRRKGLKSSSAPKWPSDIFLHAHNNNKKQLERMLEIVAFTRHYDNNKTEMPLLPTRDPSLKLTLVLDLDGTLYNNCECFEDEIILPPGSISYKVPLAQPNMDFDSEVDHDTLVIRPYTREFLKWASRYFEIVFWTAATEEYARPRIEALCGDKIDENSNFMKKRAYYDSINGEVRSKYLSENENISQNISKSNDNKDNDDMEKIEMDSPYYSNEENKKSDRHWVSHVLYRDCCSYCGGNYVKDLRKLGRPLDSIVLLDDNLISATSTMNNIIPIKRFLVPQYNENVLPDISKESEYYEDVELLRVVPILKKIIDKASVFNVMKNHCNSKSIETAIMGYERKLESTVFRYGRY